MNSNTGYKLTRNHQYCIFTHNTNVTETRQRLETSEDEHGLCSTSAVRKFFPK